MPAHKFCAALLALLAIAAPQVNAQAAAPSAASKGNCADELRARGLTQGKPGFDTEYVACGQRRRAAVLSGTQGQDAQVIALCKDELVDRGFVPGLGAYQAEMNQCLARRKSEGSAGTADFTPDKPFGRGKVQDYLNAIYSGDLAALRAADAELAQRMQTRMNVSLFNLVAQNYLAAYPVIYKSCLEPDAPTVTVGETFDEVKRDGRGVEISRRQVDKRQKIPVNRRLLPVARHAGVKASGSGEDFVSRMAGFELGELSFGNIGSIVRRTMHRRTCDDPVTRRLEEALVKYSERGGVR
jgi:hypothetical protein